jgi:hypothetical protein
MTTQIQNSVQSKVELTPAQAEAAAFLASVKALADVGNSLKPEALQEVARKLGASTNKYGRPDLASFVGFALAMSGRNLSFNARVGLAQTANGAAATWAKPAFRTATKVSEVEGNLSFKLNMPAQFETAIG